MNIAELGKSPHADPLVKTILEHDLARHIVELDAYGFTVIPPEKLGTSPGFAERLRDAILNTYQKRHNVDIDDWQTADLPAPNEMAWQLVDEDDVITEAVLNPVVLAMARWHCGQSAILGGTSSIIKPPHEKNYLAIHNDTHGVPPPQAAYTHLVNTSWVLTDYASREDGPTVFVPGSHRWGRAPAPHETNFWEWEGEDRLYEPVPIEAKAGSLAVWGGNTWHGAMNRQSTGLRVTMVLVWIRSYMQRLNMWDDGAVSPERLERYPELHKILGYDHPYPFREHVDKPDKIMDMMAPGQDQFA